MLIRACSKRTGRTMIPPPRTPWFTLPQPQPQAQVRLFGFPHAGGGTVFFRPWLAHTPPNIEWCLVALPGREQRLREPPVQRLEHLVALLAEAIIPFLSKPAVFWGHSMGAFVAFELARELVRRQHGGPVHLVVSGQRAPQRSAAPPPIHHLPEAAFVAAIQQRYDAIPAPILQEPELLQLFLPALRADVALLETYTYHERARLRCPISAFGGMDDATISADDIAAWQAQTDGAFRVRMFPGGHFFPNALRSEMLRALAQDLAAVF